MADKKTDPTLEDLAAQIETLRADIAAIAESASAYGRARGEQALGRARATAEHTLNEGERMAAEAGRYAGDKADEALEAVRRQPMLALAIAAGVGFLIGMTRRR
ncbi:DUF883 domain-containing protein [Psychromarinibacter sp. C21-152]|uniref:DUF883 domain-containing protein n=1 Tax=Psychromarinibacter sediminicola TaxID=3033385 RepID=A0AAE3NNJ3_9RHOB|nr:DUF883 domain-containing protein [Psychromarinibacter sediminicola]MDF0599541.1 DUF883 domain-containing protein [Psychromarinibacter sediminicola]